MLCPTCALNPQAHPTTTPAYANPTYTSSSDDVVVVAAAGVAGVAGVAAAVAVAARVMLE